MFTNEFDFEGTVTTILDEEGSHEDVQLVIEDDVVYIKQFSDIDNPILENVPDVIVMTPKMFKDMLASIKPY